MLLLAIGCRRWPYRRFTIQRSPRISTRANLPLIAVGCRADCSGERRTSPVNGIERSLSRAVVPKTKSLPVCATTFPTALSWYIAQGRLRKDIRSLSKMFPKAEPLPFEKEINVVLTSTLLAWSITTKCSWVIHGRLTSERKASPAMPDRHTRFINHSTLLLERSSAKLLGFTCTVHSSTRQAKKASMRRVDARWGNYMHDHSRFQRDIDWRHRRLSLSLYLSQKSLTHNIGSASALPIIVFNCLWFSSSLLCIAIWTLVLFSDFATSAFPRQPSGLRGVLFVTAINLCGLTSAEQLLWVQAWSMNDFVCLSSYRPLWSLPSCL